MTQKISMLALTVIATATVLAERFVTGNGAHTAAGASSFGVSNTSANAGERFAADVLGTTVVVAGGAIAKDAAIEVGTAGKAITRNTGKIVAKAIQAAAADGDRIEVLLIPNG
jgi:hypothetical protein